MTEISAVGSFWVTKIIFKLKTIFFKKITPNLKVSKFFTAKIVALKTFFGTQKHPKQKFQPSCFLFHDFLLTF
jgi:hypothetical protein